MELSFSEEQSMLRDMVSRLCREQSPLSLLRELEGTEPGYSQDFWQQLTELGLSGLRIDEQYGGLQLGALESVVVAEEFGRCLAVSPFFSSSVIGAGLLASSADKNQQDALLPELAGGAKIISVASDEYNSGFGADSIAVSASQWGDSYRLSGAKYYVPFGSAADAVIVLARLENESSTIIGLLLDKNLLGSSSVSLSYLPNHAQEPLHRMVFEETEVPAANVLNAGRCIWDRWQQTLSAGIIPLAAYAIGAAQSVQEITVDYAKYRRAFGRPIGGFQAIAHYLAEIEVLVEGARTLVYQAAWAQDQDKPFGQLAAMAKLQACDAFCRAAAIAIQVHGGIGYTIEADPQLFFRKAKQLQQMVWGSEYLEQKIALDLFAA